MEVTSIDKECKYVHLVSIKFLPAVSFWKNISRFVYQIVFKFFVID